MKRVLYALAITALAAFGAIKIAGCGKGMRVATYNIRNFGKGDTDVERLAEIVRGLDADVVAIQEIQSDRAVAGLARRISSGGRNYRYALSKCGGRSDMKVGFLFDGERVVLRRTKEYPELDPGGGGSCGGGERAALLGVFVPRSEESTARDEDAIQLLVIHLTPGGDREQVAKREAQWKRAHQIVASVRDAGARHVAILGDTNSTGYLDNDHGERDAIDRAAGEAGMVVTTSDLDCSEYWKTREGIYSPSLLDHVVATRGLVRGGSMRVSGYCEELRCKAIESGEPPSDFSRVSDHCPVTVEMSR
jgi:endonuclease/exonuclease/phosphatase family metal-dependent hydrolase